MLKLYFGDDTYSLNHELKKLEADFSVAHFGDINIQKIDGSNVSYDNLMRSIAAVPFLSEKRLIIIKNFIRDADDKSKEYIEKNFERLPSSSEVVLVEEYEVKKNLGLYKKLEKKKQTVHFPTRKGFELEKWLLNYSKEKKIPLGLAAAKKLIGTAGNNSWRLTNELEKLDLFRLAKKQSEITSKDIDEMVQTEHNENIFDFIDALGNKNSKLALKYLQSLLFGGKNENYILTMIVFQFRNMLIVQDLISKGIRGKQLEEESELHPFVVSKTVKILKNFDLPQLKRIYYRLQQVDIDIKTGMIEPKIALEKLLIDLTM